MQSSHTYVKELELLILDKLLPVYEKYYQAKNIKDSLKDINPDLLAQIKSKKKLPALLVEKQA
jgi:hypothetical protein